MLHHFDVDASTEQVYQAMLASPGADVATLAGSLGLSVDEVQARLDQLADLMLIEATGRPDGRIVTVPPHEALELLIAREEERLAERKREGAASREKLADVVDSFLAHRVTKAEGGLIEQIDEGRVVRSRLFQLVNQARRAVSSIEPGAPIPPHALAAATRLDDDMLGRGILVRTVVSTASTAQDYWHSHLLDQQAKGSQARSHAAPPMRLIVIDDDVAVLPRSGGSGALIAHTPDVVAPALALFESVWVEASPIERRDDTDDTVSEARMRQVATLLAAGLKDETIARRLDVSVRTVRRLVSATVAELQADSRFQAGVLAVRRGWVS